MVDDASRGELATNGAVAAKKMNVFARIALFFRQVFAELRKVVTPTRKELIKFTAVVLGFVVVMMALVFGLDTLFLAMANIVFGVPS
ncbi:hypothetical protein GCM10009860_24000 [Microbacterium mitrae]|uniref:Protein translocase subunit SecE n=1 Tax=Microbacterium mitrae TaxID=664640 RepID=A0A5C8HLI4_9MICO|nr:preprotein translocase subunit SecE [Microbacterium mitrae]TXK03009.1 preprotein translocase subunit SecE [Microbacterium mitrae]